MRNDRLLPLLERLAETALPMHMPGGKRRFPSVLPYRLDATELPALDDFHAPTGVLRTLERRASALWRCEQTFVLVNGGTGALLSAVRATGRGTLLIARNCHRSVYNAAELCRLPLAFLVPEPDGTILPETVEKAFQNGQNIELAVITSPTYEGVVSDVSAIAAICHRHGARLLVDEAHGSHLAFLPGWEGRTAVRCGADFVVHSLHKTLPALTQTALLHAPADWTERLRFACSVFETSSPSYVLLASVDECLAFLERGDAAAVWRAYADALDETRERMFDDLRHFRLYDAENAEPGKLLLLTGGTSGAETAKALRERFAIDVEYAYPDRLLAMTSVCDDRETLGRFADAVLTLDGEATGEGAPEHPPLFGQNTQKSLPQAVFQPFELYGAPSRTVPLAASAGEISLEYVWAYPPGIPVLLPGERVPEGLPERLHTLAASGVSVRSSFGAFPTLSVLA